MNFDKNAYTVESLTVGVHTIRYRQFADLLYADLPANAAYQRMHIYAPEGFYEGESINGYTLATAPVFMPNQVGGYMPGEPAAPGETQEGSGIPNTVFCALEHGYVVAAPAIRGRVQQDENKTYTGKAPACIVVIKRRCVICMHLPRICRAMRKRLSQTGQVRAAHCLRWSAVQETTRIMSRI